MSDFKNPGDGQNHAAQEPSNPVGAMDNARMSASGACYVILSFPFVYRLLSQATFLIATLESDDPSSI